MTSVSDHDWDQINAFADGELPTTEAAILERRIAAEPALAQALACVRQTSSALSALNPQTTAPAPKPARKTTWIWAAAATAAAVALIATLLTNTTPKNTPATLHAAYAAQSFNAAPGSDLRLANDGFINGFPLLSGANLTLAATRVEDTTTSAHFIGVNGCRLTILRGEGAAPQVPEDMQATGWQAGPQWFLAVATGMDQAKFDAVTQFVKQSSLDQLEQTTVLAMQGAVEKAVPCNIG